MKYRQWMLAATAAVAIAAAAAGTASADVRAGIEQWRAGNYEAAIREWRPLAERGDADAQFNLGQAYRLGRGVAADPRTSNMWFERAARQGHAQAEANLALSLFQSGERERSIPWLERAAERGDRRAQYYLGTAHFNGDLVARDWPRAYALMSRSAEQGLPQARTSLAEMERHLSADERARGSVLARQMAVASRPGTVIATAAPPPPPAGAPQRSSRVAGTQPPIARTQTAPPPVVVRTPAPRVAAPARQAPAPAAAGRWRVQLGAFSNQGNAQRQWNAVRGRIAGLSGLQHYYVRAGAITRLQAGPLASRAAANRLCASARAAGAACMVVAP
ncbi:MAG TPA: SPOR domain-containing protein [Allosphingosinicella sp.]|jgi:cell division septation protein DedD